MCRPICFCGTGCQGTGWKPTPSSIMAKRTLLVEIGGRERADREILTCGSRIMGDAALGKVTNAKP
ncbi:hypothetical protein J2X65_004349 [Ancylobacter sp. 3268]|uniref:hypothetical protein n=1 Tax=Ancylobacter sp. 3268 TaxID=2817752 RepID=UPI0028558884|nr:hypothetical protein [Ancylobacter sp. 3268]MDR6954973.1 hypothetical protein [Ancylobacter sp. 3268]